jgi:hypothetical protein
VGPADLAEVFTLDFSSRQVNQTSAACRVFKPRDRQAIDGVGKRDLARRLTGRHTPQGFARLLRRQLVRAAEDHSTAYMPPVDQTSAVCGSVAPEVSKPCRRKLGVSDGVLDRAMAQPALNGARIVTRVGENVTASVLKHVRVDSRQSCALAACG